MSDQKSSGCSGCLGLAFAGFVMLMLWTFGTSLKSVSSPDKPASASPGKDKKESWLGGVIKESHEASEKQQKDLEPKKAAFIAWLKENTSVTDCAFSDSGSSLFVTLKAEKYTTPDNVSALASNISRWWSQKSGVSYVNTHIYFRGREYASGSN